MEGLRFKGVIGSALLLVLLALTGAASPVAAGPVDPDRESIDVRFVGVAELRGSNRNLRAGSEQALEGVEGLLQQVGAMNTEPLASGISQSTAGEIAAEARERSGARGVNMANWYRVEVPAGRAESALAMLRSSALVSHAERAPTALRPPVTPDFTPLQLHLDPGPTGIGAEFSSVEPSIRGAGVTIVDLEYYWTRTHEDLLLPESSDLGGGEYIQYTAFDDEHGTAVFGILGARDNGFGVTGIVPEATLKGISPTMAPDFGYNPAGALTYLADKLDPGDVVLIEQQADGPGPGSSDFVPMEWNQASFDAIRQLSNLGVIVVETGGNGGYDLDSPALLGRFDRSIRDSGAIIVGAGDSVTRAPLWFTSHGSRVDLQGYGGDIVTTGSDGDLQGPSPAEKNTRYTSSFGGTSGAGPIVAGAVGAVLSYLKSEGQPVPDSAQMIDLLRSTGTPQSSPELGLIGPLPNIQAAVAQLDGSAPTVTINAPAGGASFDFNSARNLDLSCGPGGGPALESCLAVDQGPTGTVSLVNGDQLPTDQPGSHTVTATATNQFGLTATDTVTYEVGPGCFASGVTLAAVQPRGRNVRLLGATDPEKAGSAATVQRNGRRAGTATVRPDGTITVAVAAPLARKARPKATYRLVVGGNRSKAMKPNGGVRIISRKPLPTADLVKAKLSGVKKKGRLTVRTSPLCGGPSTSRQVSHDRKGVFKVNLGFGSAARSYTVVKSGRQVPLPLVLPAARFVFAN